jgi:hypothetical protein
MNGCWAATPRRRQCSIKDNVTVDVTWPYPSESGVASCAVTIKHGDKVVSKSRMQLQVEGPGRTPLVVTAQAVNPNSVKVVAEDPSRFLVLLEFAGRTKEEVKRLANENYGNKVQVRDSQGQVMEGGISLGAYHEIGMSLHYKSQDEAKRAAGILRGENPG